MPMPRCNGKVQSRAASTVAGSLAGGGLLGGIGYTHGGDIILAAALGAILLGALGYGVASRTMSPVTLCTVLFALFFAMIGPGCDDYGGITVPPAALFGAFIGWLFFGHR
jgi:hypothetical protein